MIAALDLALCDQPAIACLGMVALAIAYLWLIAVTGKGMTK